MQKKNVSWLIVLSSLILAKCGNTVVSSSGSSVSSEGTSSSEKTSTTSSSSVDSSSSKEATYKAIADSTITNGTVAFDKTSYLPLDIVTITVTPNEGYYLSGITLDDSDVPLTTVTEGTTYTFVMPAKDVTVNATFVNDYHVTSLRKINWGTYIKSLTLADGTTEVTTDTTFKAGETVTLNVYSGTSFDWSGGFYYTNTQQFFLNVNDETYTSKLPDDFVHTDTKSNVDHFVFSFVMPAKNVDLYVTYNNGAYISDTGYQVNVQADAGVKLLGFDPNAKYSYVSFFVLREDNTLVSIQYQYKNQTAWNDLSLNFDYTSQQYFTDNISSTSSITISSDTTVKATAKEVSKAAINYVNDDKVTFTSNSGTAMTQALPGDRVNMTYTIKDQNNVLLETTLTGIDSTHLKNNQIGQLSFDMPENPITITFNYVEGQKVTFVDNDYVLQVKGVRRSLTDSTAYPTVQSGKEFYLFVDDISLDTGKLLTGAKLNGGDIVSLTTSYSGKYFTFKMPETGTAEITLLTANAYNVSVISVTGGTLYLSSSDKSFGAGASINGTYYAESLYSLTSIALLNVKDADITSAITSLSYKDGSFSFIMPSYSVQIKPTWTKQESYFLTVDLGSDTSKFGNTTTGRSYVQGLKNYGYYYFPADKTDTAVSFGKGEQITMSVKLLDATVIPISDQTITLPVPILSLIGIPLLLPLSLLSTVTFLYPSN